MTYITCPASVDNTGHLDESVALSDWLSTTKAKSGRTQLRLRRPGGTGPGVYFVWSGVWLDNPGVDLDLNGCWLITHEGPGEGTEPIAPELKSLWPRQRSVLNIGDDVKVWSSRAGARLMGGAREPAYKGDWAIGVRYTGQSLEGQKAVRVRGSGCVLDFSNVEAAWCYGDAVYVEWWVHNTEIKGKAVAAYARDERGGKVVGDVWKPDLGPTPGLHHCGRQGVAQSGGGGLWVHDLTMWQITRTLFDFEPGAGGTMDGVDIARVISGAFQGDWISAGGNGFVHGLHADGCTNLKRPLKVYCKAAPNGGRKVDWEITNNKADRAKAFYGSPIDCMRFYSVDGVRVAGNYQPVDHRQAGRGTYFEDCTGVDVPDGDAQFPLV